MSYNRLWIYNDLEIKSLIFLNQDIYHQYSKPSMTSRYSYKIPNLSLLRSVSASVSSSPALLLDMDLSLCSFIWDLTASGPLHQLSPPHLHTEALSHHSWLSINIISSKNLSPTSSKVARIYSQSLPYFNFLNSLGGNIFFLFSYLRE